MCGSDDHRTLNLIGIHHAEGSVENAHTQNHNEHDIAALASIGESEHTVVREENHTQAEEKRRLKDEVEAYAYGYEQQDSFKDQHVRSKVCRRAFEGREQPNLIAQPIRVNV